MGSESWEDWGGSRPSRRPGGAPSFLQAKEKETGKQRWEERRERDGEKGRQKALRWRQMKDRAERNEVRKRGRERKERRAERERKGGRERHTQRER